MLVWFYRVVVVLSTAFFLQSCTQVEDYMLGKDNTIQPQPLSPIKEKMTLVKKWSTFTGKQGKSSADLKLGPVLKNGVIYTASAEGLIQATEIEKGKILWSKQMSQHLMSGPAVNNGYIAVTTNASTVVVLNQSNGHVIWQATLSADSLAKPVITEHQVLVKSIDGNLYAFNLRTGEKLWVVDHGAPHLILKASSSPIIMDKLTLVGFSDGKLDAVERETGRVIWQRNIAYSPTGGSDIEGLVDIDADPIVRGSQLYLASYQGYIGALSFKDGEFIWRKPASIYQNMVINGDTIYYVDSESGVWARNRTTGNVKWKQLALKGRGLTEPAIMGSHLMVGDRNGFLHGLDLSNGGLISRTPIQSPIFATPVVSGLNIYVLEANGQLSRFEVN